MKFIVRSVLCMINEATEKLILTQILTKSEKKGIFDMLKGNAKTF